MRFDLSTIPASRRKVIIYTCLIGLVTLGIFTFIAWPSLTVIKTLNNQIYEQRVELEKMYRRGQILKQTVKEYEQVKPQVFGLQQIFVNRGQELDLITALENTAVATNVIQTIKLGAVNPTADHPLLPLELQVTGNTNQIITYLAGLESLNYYLNIDTVRLISNRQGDTTNTKALTAIFLANAFYKK